MIRHWFLLLFVFSLISTRHFTNAFLSTENDCYISSMVDFVKEKLPQICFQSDSVGFLNVSMNDVEFYNAHCRIYSDIQQCLETKLKDCDRIRPGFHRHVLNLIESYQLPLEYFDYDAKIFDDQHYLQNLIPFCDGEKLSKHFSDKFHRSLLNCVTKTTLNKHKECLTTFKMNIQRILETRASLNEITKWSEDFLRCIYNSIPTHCSSATKEVFVFKELMAIPDKQDPSTSTALNITKIIKQKLPSENVQGFSQSKRATSSIHGDPHLVQLHSTKAITCKLLQNRTYLSNPYLKMTGVSKHIGDPSLTATALTSIQIDYFDSNGNLLVYYRANHGQLPFTLIQVNPNVSSSIVKIEYGEHHAKEGHLILTHLPTSTQIIVNVWSKYYYFLVRSSELILNNSHGYLITGCPPDEIIDRQAIIARLRERFARSQRQISIVQSRQRREIILKESEIPEQCLDSCSTNDNEYPDECLFDCLALALVNVSQALQVHEIHLKISREREELVKNDYRVIKEFQQCYREGLICPRTNDIMDDGVRHPISILIIILSHVFLLIFQ